MTFGWLARYATRVAVRRVVIVLVLALLAWAGIGRAKATNCESYNDRCVRAEAYAACQATKDYTVQRSLSIGGPGTVLNDCTSTHGANGPDGGYYRCLVKYSDTHSLCYQPSTNIQQFDHFYTSTSCPTGTEWDDYSKTCFSGEQCLARNSELGSAKDQPRPSATTSRCVAGCQFAMQGTPERTTIGTAVIYRGVMEYTGYSCGASQTDPEAPLEDQKKIPNQECVPIGDGEGNACLKPDGQHCLSAARTDKQFCWMPGETGQKTDADMMQKRDPGDTPIPPNMQLPSGDSLAQKGQPTTTTTTTNNTTTTTTTTNYTTVSGTNAGTSNQGEPSDGSASPDGEKDGKGTASGGGDCETPPITTGDPVVGMVATQAWATRCAVEAGNTAKISGDVGDCKSPFSVDGDNANAVKLRAMRAQICGDKADNEGDASSLAADSDGMEAEFDSVFGDGDGEPGRGLDSNWFTGGGGGCPDLSFTLPAHAGGASWRAPPEFCERLAWLSLFFQVIAMVWGVRVVAGGD